MSADQIHLDEIGQIAITVSDLERAKKFYGQRLGMRFLFDAGSMAFYQCGAVRLMIGTGGSPVSGDGTILYFRVAEIETLHRELLRSGVEFSHEPHLVARMPDHDLWMAFLKDPDGRSIGLMSEVAGSRARV